MRPGVKAVYTPTMHKFKLALVLPVLLLAACGEDAPDASPRMETAGIDRVVAWFASQDLHVITFTGYSGAGYEDPEAMLAAARGVLEAHDPERTLVNIGATPDGIGAVYEIARRMGFRTSGIVSTQAEPYKESITYHVQKVFFVEDETWGGYQDGTKTLAPTSEAMVQVSDEMVGIGGGAVGRDELLEARTRGKPVRFIAADMNHGRAVAKAKDKGKQPPTDFRGDAHLALANR